MKKKVYPMYNQKKIQISFKNKVLVAKKIIIKITSYLLKYLISLITLIKQPIVNKTLNLMIFLQDELDRQALL